MSELQQEPNEQTEIPSPEDLPSDIDHLPKDAAWLFP